MYVRKSQFFPHPHQNYAQKVITVPIRDILPGWVRIRDSHPPNSILSSAFTQEGCTCRQEFLAHLCILLKLGPHTALHDMFAVLLPEGAYLCILLEGVLSCQSFHLRRISCAQNFFKEIEPMARKHLLRHHVLLDTGVVVTCIGERGEIPIAEGGVWIGNEVETNDVACNNLLPSLFPNL